MLIFGDYKQGSSGILLAIQWHVILISLLIGPSLVAFGSVRNVLQAKTSISIRQIVTRSFDDTNPDEFAFNVLYINSEHFGLIRQLLRKCLRRGGGVWMHSVNVFCTHTYTHTHTHKHIHIHTDATRSITNNHHCIQYNAHSVLSTYCVSFA